MPGAPLALWFLAGVAWSFGPGGRRMLVPLALLAAVAFGGHFVAAPALGWSRLAVNDYKGVAYARKFPDAERVYESVSPFGYVEAYASSYLHFAPGLSDNAAFNLPSVPANAYLAMYIDSDGPIGVMRHLDVVRRLKECVRQHGHQNGEHRVQHRCATVFASTVHARYTAWRITRGIVSLSIP